MDGIPLHDEAVRDRIRLAEEFLDPRKQLYDLYLNGSLLLQMILPLEGRPSHIDVEPRLIPV